MWSIMDPRYSALEQCLEDLFHLDGSLTEEQFNRLALDLFQFQIESNPFYQRFCQALEMEHPARWQDIPAVPTSAFKRTAVCSFPPEEASTFFQTSGTTEGESGRHYFASLRLYEAAILSPFSRYLLPDAPARMRMLVLTPPPAQAPNSSLVHMMQTVTHAFGTPESAYYIHESQLEAQALLEALRACQAQGEPVFLLGTAFAFVYLLEEAARRNLRFNLPQGSRIMETGGFKGRTREIGREEFYRLLSQATGVPPTHIVNEYGMTELSSQFYDTSLRNGAPSNLKGSPGWTRVRVVDPLTGQDAPAGRPGLIRIYDLANLGSVIALQTEDMGIMHPEGFEVLGRVKSAAPRGCSLSAETLFTAKERP